MKEKKPCTGPCLGSGYLGIVAPESVDIEKITHENLVLIPCVRCGGSGFEEVMYKPDDTSYDTDGTVLN